MTRWVDEPVWGDSLARQLLATISQGVPDTQDMKAIWEDAGLALDTVYWEAPARTVWPGMLKDAHRAGRLEQLLQAVIARRPILAGALAPAFGVLPSTCWYASDDLYETRMLGPGASLPLLDRARLSRNLRDVVVDQYPVCNIRGKSGQGKSWSRVLIQHLAEHPDIDSDPIHIDVELDELSGAKAPAFATALAERLGMNPTFAVDPYTHEISVAGSLARTFLARFKELPHRKRWILIDGVDRLGGDIHAFVSRLALAATRDELPGVRLFITGHPGNFPEPVLEVLRDEPIDPIERWHVERFFTDIGQHVNKPVSNGEAADLADRVLANAQLSDLRGLGREAAKVAREHFS